MRLKTALTILPKLLGSNGYLRTAGYIFVVGHMRSYSSLLSHVLGSHPQVVGYAEMHQKYRNRLDLLELNRKVERTCDKASAGRYVLDKILHPQVLASRVLLRADVQIVAIAREPQASLSSILSIGAGGIDRIETAIEYYMERMATLTCIAEARDGNLLYLDGESLIERTRETLASLTAHLRLGSGLRSEYSVFPHTGVPKYGDPSPWIKSGQVVAVRAPLPSIALNSSQAERVFGAYERMRIYMVKHARFALLSSWPQKTEAVRAA